MNSATHSDYIVWGAFQGCASLRNLNIPNVTCIGQNVCGIRQGTEEGAFRNCSSDLTFSDLATRFWVFASENCSSLANLTIPNSVTHHFGFGAFWDCTSLRNLNIGQNILRGLEEGALRKCSSHLTIPDLATRIWDSALENWSFFANLTIPGWMTDMWDSALENCKSV